MARLLAALSALILVVVMWARPARAEKPVVTVHVTGTGAGKLRGKIVGALPEGLSAKNANAAVKKASKGLAAKKKKPKAIKDLAKAAKKADVAAVVVATAKGKKVAVLVIDGPSGDVLLDETVKAADAPARVSDALSTVALRFAPEVEEPIVEMPDEGGGGDGGGDGDGDGGDGGDGDGEEKPAATAKKKKGPTGPHGPYVIAGAGITLGGRSLSYSNPSSPMLRDYSLFGAMLFNVSLEGYPLVKKPGLLGALAVTFDFDQSVGLQSKTATEEFPTTWREWSLGARLRFGPWQPTARAFGASLQFGGTAFSFDPPADGTVYPTASYTFMRVGGDARLPAGPVMVEAGLGLRLVVGTGGLTDTFAGASGTGFDLGATAAYKIGPPGMEAFGGFSLTRYGLSFENDAAQMFSADGSSELMYGFGIGARYRK